MKEDIISMAREAGISQSHAEGMADFLERFAALVVAAEREACAKVCERRGMVKGGEVFAARIRARGQA